MTKATEITKLPFGTPLPDGKAMINGKKLNENDKAYITEYMKVYMRMNLDHMDDDDCPIAAKYGISKDARKQNFRESLYKQYLNNFCTTPEYSKYQPIRVSRRTISCDCCHNAYVRESRDHDEFRCCACGDIWICGNCDNANALCSSCVDLSDDE